jgi:glycosyltransferase involved in cell wall biosynthesis
LNKQLKILHVLYSGLGGHGNVVFSLLETDFGKTHNNTLVFYGVENVREEYLKKVNKMKISSHSIIKRPKHYIKGFKIFKKILHLEKPDRIIVHSSELIIPAIKYSKKNRECKVFYVEHEPNHTKTRFELYISRYAAKKVDKIVCLNESYKSDIKSKYGIKNNIEVIPNGINTEKFCSNKTGSKPRKLGIAARITKTKDHAILIQAFKKLTKDYSDLNLIIAGTGDLLEEIKNLCKKENLSGKVVFSGLLDENQIIDFYKEIDVYVHASKSETLSTSILQAMSCSLPVIASNIDNNSLLLQHGKTGWLYKNENAADLERQIREVLDNFELANKIAVAGREHVISSYSNLEMSFKYNKLVQ